MTAEFAIRTATRADVPAIKHVLATTWHATYDAIDGPEAVARITDVWHAESVLEGQLDQPGSCFLVAETGTVGIVGTALARRPMGAATVELSRLYILPAYQGAGLGRRLLAAALAPFAGARSVTLEVAPENAGAIAFYVRQGFVPAGRTQNCGQPGSGLAAAIYRKNL